MPKIKLLDSLNHNGTEFDRDAVIDTDDIDITESQLACLLSAGAVQVLPVVDAGTPKKPAKGKAAKQVAEDNGMNALIEGGPIADTAPADEAG